MYLHSTSLTHGHSSPYLGPGTWVLTSGSLQMGLKWFINLWDTYWVLGPGSRAKVQPFFYATWFLGPRSRDLSTFGTLIGSWVPGTRSWVRTQDLGPKTRLADLFCDWFFKIGRGQDFWSLECCVRFCLFIWGLFLLIRPLYQFSLQLLI